MLFPEFALEPSLLSNWRTFQFFDSSFGLDKGRLISQFPKSWKRLVYQSLADCSDIERKRIEERLARINSKLVRNNRHFDSTVDWLTNAEVEHGRLAFKAIVAERNVRGHAAVLEVDQLDEHDPRWAPVSQLNVVRAAVQMTRAVEPLFRLSRELIFIDPHFDPNASRFRNVLRAMLEVANSSGPFSRIEIHCGPGLEARYLEGGCRQYLSPVMPHGVLLTVKQWRQRIGGEILHDRFLLTDVGGVQFSVGLDEGSAGQTTQISSLSPAIRAHVYTSYASAHPAFDLAHQFTVPSSR